MRKFAGLVLMLLSLSGPGSAIEIEPGMWDVKLETHLSMLPAPQIKTLQQCMEKSTVMAEDFTKDAGNCQVSNVKDSKKALSYDISCSTPQGAMTGTAQFFSEGSSAKGSTRMSMDIKGQSMSVESSWSGKRAGACP